MNRQEFIDKLFAKAKAEGLEEFEAYFGSSDSFEVNVLEGEINEYSVSSSSGMGFRGVFAGRMGYASTEVLDDDAIDMLVKGVKENASLLETDDNETIFEGSKEYPEVNLYDEKIAAIPASKKIADCLELEKKVKALDARVQRLDGAAYVTSVGESRIVNSRGMDISQKSAVCGCYAVPVVKEGDNVDYGMDIKFSRHPEEIDIDEVAKKAVADAVEGLGGKSIPSGSYKVVFRNDMARTLLGTFGTVFSGETARKGLSLLKGKEGETIAAECVTLVDNPLLENGGATAAYDGEGVAHSAHNVIENGKFITLLHNRMTAAAMGTETTANAARGGFAGKITVAPTNFYIVPGEKTQEEIFEEVGDGLLITSLMGMHSGANAVSGDFSLGAKGFRIENGRKGAPVEQITVAGNFFDILKNVRAVGSDLEFGQPGGSCIGSPCLYVGEMSVAGL